MYNIEIREIEICTGPIIEGSEYRWYVNRLPKNLDPSFDYAFYEYLHQDGVWRATTSHNGEFTGYFPTKEKAKEVLDSVTEKEE